MGADVIYVLSWWCFTYPFSLFQCFNGNYLCREQGRRRISVCGLQWREHVRRL